MSKATLFLFSLVLAAAGCGAADSAEEGESLSATSASSAAGQTWTCNGLFDEIASRHFDKDLVSGTVHIGYGCGQPMSRVTIDSNPYGGWTMAQLFVGNRGWQSPWSTNPYVGRPVDTGDYNSNSLSWGSSESMACARVSTFGSNDLAACISTAQAECFSCETSNINLCHPGHRIISAPGKPGSYICCCKQ